MYKNIPMPNTVSVPLLNVSSYRGENVSLQIQAQGMTVFMSVTPETLLNLSEELLKAYGEVCDEKRQEKERQAKEAEESASA